MTILDNSNKKSAAFANTWLQTKYSYVRTDIIIPVNGTKCIFLFNVDHMLNFGNAWLQN